MRLSLPPQYSRLLLGVFLGFILGTVLYQSQRREWNVRGDVGPTNSCIENKVSNSCPSGGVNMGTYCYLPEGAPCDAFGEQGTCGAGACIPVPVACNPSVCALEGVELYECNAIGSPPVIVGSPLTCPAPCVKGAVTTTICQATGVVDTITCGCPASSSSSVNQCAALGTACGTSVTIPCSDTDPNNPMQPTPTCAGFGNYCVANTNCHVPKTVSCCAGSTCDSNTNTCVDKPDYCCNTSNYMCYPSSSSSSSSSCGGLFAGCANGSDCCSGSCNTTGSCMCAPTGASCSNTSTGFNYCCSNTCTNGICTTSSSSSIASACALGESYCINNDGSTLCCPSPSTCVDTNTDGNYECSGSPPTTTPPATTNPTTTNPTVANPAVADPTTVCPAGQCCPACGADFTCITLVQGSPTCIPNDYLSSTSSSSSQCTFGSCGTSADCCGNNVCQNGSCVNQSCNSPTISCGDRCCLPSEACFIQGNSARCETISSSSSSCMSTGQYCGMSCDRCCSGNGTLFFCS